MPDYEENFRVSLAMTVVGLLAADPLHLIPMLDKISQK